MRKIRVGVDIDDTLCATAEYLLERFNLEHKTNFNISDIGESYYIQDFLAKNTEKDEKYCEIKIFQYFDEMNIRLNLGVYDALVDLVKVADLDIVTARAHDRYFNITKKWLISQDILRFFTNFGFIHSFHEISDQNKKVDYCTDKGLEHIIEDAPHHALDCANGGIKVILYDRPWNRNLSHENIYRVSSWAEIPKVFENNLIISLK